MRRPIRVLVTHAYTRDNRGDDAILSVTLQQICNMFPNALITLMSTFAMKDKRFSTTPFTPSPRLNEHTTVEALLPSPTMILKQQAVPSKWRSLGNIVSYGARAIFLLLTARRIPQAGLAILRGPARESYQALLDSDIIVAKGGGYLYASPGVKAFLRLGLLLYPIWLACVLQKPVVLFPQSIGPFQSRLARFLARHVLNRCSIIMTREPLSQKTVRKLGVRRPIVAVVPDVAFAFGQHVSRPIKQPGDPPMVGITVRPWRFEGAPDARAQYYRYLQAIAETARHLIERYDAKIYLIPHVIGPGPQEDDRIATKELFELLKVYRDRVCLDTRKYTAEEIRKRYAELDLLIATRLHSAIFAVTVGTPVIVIAYMRNKGFGIMQMLGLENYVFDIHGLEGPPLIAAVDRILTGSDARIANLSKAVEAVQHSLKEAMAEFSQVLSQLVNRTYRTGHGPRELSHVE